MNDQADQDAETAAELAAAQGVILASDCLRAARERNPHIQIDFIERRGRNILAVKTDRGTIYEPRGDLERWYDTFVRLGLL